MNPLYLKETGLCRVSKRDVMKTVHKNNVENQSCKRVNGHYCNNLNFIEKLNDELGISRYVANALLYFASRERGKKGIKEINKATEYLENLRQSPTRQKEEIWNSYPPIDIGDCFKDLSVVITEQYEQEDIEKVLICLYGLSDLIQKKNELWRVLADFKARQAVHELKQELALKRKIENTKR